MIAPGDAAIRSFTARRRRRAVRVGSRDKSDWPHIEGMPQPLDYAPELAPSDDAARTRILRDNTVELNAARPA